MSPAVLDSVRGAAQPRRVERSPFRATWTRWTVAASLGVTALGAVALHGMGRRLWCSCGSASPWAWNIWSPHNSQHLIDPYTFTHVLHGALYYALLWLIFRGRWPGLRAVVAVMVEVGWEIGENTNAIIEAYRESTISLNYYGDSIANSLGDVAAFVLGYMAAMGLPRARLCGGVRGHRSSVAADDPRQPAPQRRDAAVPSRGRQAVAVGGIARLESRPIARYTASRSAFSRGSSVR